MTDVQNLRLLTSPRVGIYNYDNSRAKEILGIRFRSLKESVVDTVKSLQAVKG